MNTTSIRRHKLREWIRRYLPNEIASTAAEFTSIGVVYAMTGSWAAAAVVATVFASVGYYATAYINAVRWSMAGHGFGRANLLALRSLGVEFGPAEVIDSLAIRPAALYLGPVLCSNAILGLVIGKVVADIAFYVCAVFSYEKFRNMLATKQTDWKEVRDEAIDPIAAG